MNYFYYCCCGSLADQQALSGKWFLLKRSLQIRFSYYIQWLFNGGYSLRCWWPGCSAEVWHRAEEWPNGAKDWTGGEWDIAWWYVKSHKVRVFVRFTSEFQFTNLLFNVGTWYYFSLSSCRNICHVAKIGHLVEKMYLWSLLKHITQYSLFWLFLLLLIMYNCDHYCIAVLLWYLKTLVILNEREKNILNELCR